MDARDARPNSGALALLPSDIWLHVLMSIEDPVKACIMWSNLGGGCNTSASRRFFLNNWLRHNRSPFWFAWEKERSRRLYEIYDCRDIPLPASCNAGLALYVAVYRNNEVYIDWHRFRYGSDRPTETADVRDQETMFGIDLALYERAKKEGGTSSLYRLIYREEEEGGGDGIETDDDDVGTEPYTAQEKRHLNTAMDRFYRDVMARKTDFRLCIVSFDIRSRLAVHGKYVGARRITEDLLEYDSHSASLEEMFTATLTRTADVFENKDVRDWMVDIFHAAPVETALRIVSGKVDEGSSGDVTTLLRFMREQDLTFNDLFHLDESFPFILVKRSPADPAMAELICEKMYIEFVEGRAFCVAYITEIAVWAASAARAEKITILLALLNLILKFARIPQVKARTSGDVDNYVRKCVKSVKSGVSKKSGPVVKQVVDNFVNDIISG